MSGNRGNVPTTPRKIPLSGVTVTEADFAVPKVPTAGTVGVSDEQYRKSLAQREELFSKLRETGLSDKDAENIHTRLVTGKLKWEDLQFEVDTRIRTQQNKTHLPDDPRERIRQMVKDGDVQANVGMTEGEMRQLKRMQTPNITITYEAPGFMSPEEWRNHPNYNENVMPPAVPNKRVTVRNFNPATGDLQELPEIPDGAKIIERKEEKFEGEDTRARALRLYEEERYKKHLVSIAQRRMTAGLPMAPMPEAPMPSFRAIEYEIEQDRHREDEASRQKREQITDLLLKNLPFGLASAQLLPKAAKDQIGKTFVHENPIRAYIDPRTPHEQVFSGLVDAAVIGLTWGAGGAITAGGKRALQAGVITTAKEAIKKASEGGARSIIKRGLSAVGKSAVVGEHIRAKQSLFTQGIDRLGFFGEDPIFTGEDARKYLTEAFPNTYTGFLSDDQAIELAHGMAMYSRAGAIDGALSKILPEPLHKIARGLIDSRYYLAGRETLFGGNHAAETLNDYAPLLMNATRDRDQGGFVKELQDFASDYERDVKNWNSDGLEDTILHGVGFTTGILGPFRAVISAAGLKPQNTTALFKAATRYASGLNSAARATLGKELRQQMGAWTKGGLKSLGMAAAVGMATRGAPVYAKGDKIYERMVRDGYTPGQAFTTAFLVPYLNESIEFASEALFIPELGFNFARGALRRIGKRLLMTMNPYEAMEEGLGRFMTYGAETAFNVPDEYREQKEVPYFGSNGMKEAIGDLAITTISSLLTGLKTGLSGGVRAGALNLQNIMQLGNEKNRALMRRALVMTGQMSEEEVAKLNSYDLQTEFLAQKYNLGDREQTVLRSMIEQNVFGVANEDVASLLGGKIALQDGKVVRLSGLEALAQGLGFRNDTDLENFLKEVDEEWNTYSKPWRYTPENAPEMHAQPPAPAPPVAQDEQTDVPPPPSAPPPENAPPEASGEPEGGPIPPPPAPPAPAPVDLDSMSLQDLKTEWFKDQDIKVKRTFPTGDLRKKETWAKAIRARDAAPPAAKPEAPPVQAEDVKPSAGTGATKRKSLIEMAMEINDEEEADAAADRLIDASPARPTTVKAPISSQREREASIGKVRRQGTTLKGSTVKRSGSFFAHMLRSAARNALGLTETEMSARVELSDNTPLDLLAAKTMQVNDMRSASEGNAVAEKLATNMKLAFFGDATPEGALIQAKSGNAPVSASPSSLYKQLRDMGQEDLGIKMQSEMASQGVSFVLNPQTGRFDVPGRAAKNPDAFTPEEMRIIAEASEAALARSISSTFDFIDSMPGPLLARIAVERGISDRRYSTAMGLFTRGSSTLGEVLERSVGTDENIPSALLDELRSLVRDLDLGILTRPALAVKEMMKRYPELGIEKYYDENTRPRRTGEKRASHEDAVRNAVKEYAQKLARETGVRAWETEMELMQEYAYAVRDTADEVLRDIAQRLDEHPSLMDLLTYVREQLAVDDYLTGMNGSKLRTGLISMSDVTANPESIVHEIMHFVTALGEVTKTPEMQLFSDVMDEILRSSPEDVQAIEDQLIRSGYTSDQLRDEHYARIASVIMSPVHGRFRTETDGFYGHMLGRAINDDETNRRITDLFRASEPGRALLPQNEEVTKKNLWQKLIDLIRGMWKATKAKLGIKVPEQVDESTMLFTGQLFADLIMAQMRNPEAVQIDEGFTKVENWYRNSSAPNAEPAPVDLEQPENRATHREYSYGTVTTSVSPHVKSVRTDIQGDVEQAVRSAVRPGTQIETADGFRELLIENVGRYKAGEIGALEGLTNIAAGLRVPGEDPGMPGYLRKKVGWRLLSTFAQRKFQQTISPSMDRDGNVHVHQDVTFGEAPIASTLGKEREMLQNYGFQPMDPELDTAYVQVDGGNIYMEDKKGFRKRMKLGEVSSMMEKIGEDTYVVSNNFEKFLEAMASQGYYYLGPAGKNNTFMFLALNPGSVAGSGTALAALQATEAALGLGSTERAKRVAQGQATPADLMAVVQSAFGVWMDGDAWATNPEKFYKYANTYASQERTADDTLAREMFSDPDTFFELVDTSDLSPEEAKRVERAIETLYRDSKDGVELNTISPTKSEKALKKERVTTNWSIADRLAKDGYSLLKGGIAFKKNKDGKITDVRVVSVLVQHPWWYHKTEGFVTASRKNSMVKSGTPASEFREVGDGASLNSPLASMLMDMAMGSLVGRVKVEKPRIMQPGGMLRTLLFKGQFQIASGPILEWMEANGVGKLVYSTTVKRGKERWDFASLESLLSGGSVPIESLLKLNPASVSQAGSGELHDGHETSLALQALIANGFNPALFPDSKPLYDTLVDHFKERSQNTARFLQTLARNNTLRMALTKLGLSRETGEPTVYGLSLNSLLNLPEGSEHITQLPHFMAMTRHLAHKTVLSGLFDPRKDSGGARTPGSGAFLTADLGTGSETMMSVLRGQKGDPIETLRTYFEIDDVLDSTDVAPLTDQLAWKKKEKKGESEAPAEQKSPREELLRKAVVKEVDALIKEVIEYSGETKEKAILRMERDRSIIDIERTAIRNVMSAQGYTRIEHKGRTLYVSGPGFLKPEIMVDGKAAVPVVIGRNVATNAGLKPGSKCMAVAIPTDAPHSAAAAIVVGVSNDHQTVTVSPQKVLATGKDHDGDQLLIYGASEGYWTKLLAKSAFRNSLTPEEKAIYLGYAHHQHMELSERAFNAIWDHFGDPKVRHMIEDLYQKVGLSDPFAVNPVTQRSIGADLLKQMDVVGSAVEGRAEEPMSAMWNQMMTAKYVGRTAGAIGIVASTRMRIEFMIQHLHAKRKRAFATARDANGLTPLERIYLVNSLLTHHAVDVPKEKAFFEYNYTPERHVDWAIEQLYPDLSADEIKKAKAKMDQIFFMIRAGQTGQSNPNVILRNSKGKPTYRKRQLTLSQRLAALVHGRELGDKLTAYEALVSGFDHYPSYGVLEPSEYVSRVAGQLWHDVAKAAFPGMAGVSHPDVFSLGQDPGKQEVSGPARNTILGRLKHAYNNASGDVSEEEFQIARLVGDALGSISFLRQMNMRGADLDAAVMRRTLMRMMEVPVGREIVGVVLAHWADNIADQAGLAGRSMELDSAEVTRLLAERPGDILKIYGELRQITDELREKTSNDEGGNGIDAYILNSAQLRDIAKGIWQDTSEALANSPLGQDYLRMASIILASEMAFDVQLRRDDRAGRDQYMRIWNGTLQDKLTRTLQGGILSRPEQEMATPRESIGQGEEGMELITPVIWANFIGLEFLHPSLAQTLADMMAQNHYFREQQHDASIASKPLDLSEEDRDRLEHLGAEAEAALGDIDTHEAFLSEMNFGVDDEGNALFSPGTATQLQDHMTKFAGRLKRFAREAGKVLLGAASIGGVVLAPQLLGITSLSDSMNIMLAAPVLGASLMNFKSMLKKARAIFDRVYTGAMNRLPILGEMLVNGTVAAYRGTEMFQSFNPYESVGLHTGELRIWSPGGKDNYSVVPTTAGHIAEATARGGFTSNERSRKMHVINDIAAPLVRLLGEVNAMNRMHIERGVKRLPGISMSAEGSFFDRTPFIEKKPEHDEKAWSIQNEKLALQYVAEELLTGRAFDLRFMYTPQGFVFNKTVQDSFPEIKAAAAKYGSVENAQAVYDAVRGIKEFFMENFRRHIIEMINVESARPANDQADSARKAAALSSLHQTLEAINSGEHLFPVGLDGGLWAEKGAVSEKAQPSGLTTGAKNFTDLMIETQLQRDELLGKDPSQESMDVVTLETLIYFINRGGQADSEIEIIKGIAGGPGTFHGEMVSVLNKRLRLDTLKRRYEQTKRVLAEAELELSTANKVTAPGLQKLVDALKTKALAQLHNIGEARESLLQARMKIEGSDNVGKAIERAMGHMEQAFNRANRLAPVRARMTAWDPIAAKEFIDMSVMPEDGKARHLTRPLHSYLSAEMEQDLTGMFEALTDQLHEKNVIGIYDKYVRPLEKSRDRGANNAALKFLRWVEGNLHYKVFAQNISLSQVMKGEQVALEIEFTPDRKGAPPQRRVVRMTYVGKDRESGRLKFQYSTPMGMANSTVDQATGSISGIFRQQSDDVSMDLAAVAAPYLRNTTAKVVNSRVAVEDRLLESLGTSTIARGMEGAFGEGWGERYVRSVGKFGRLMWGLMNVGAGVAFLTFNPASAIRNFAYPAKMLLMGGGWVHTRKSLDELKGIVENVNADQARSIQDVLNSMPVFMFDFLQRGIGETGMEDLGTWKKNVLKSLEMMRLHADAMVDAEAEVKKLMKEQPGLVMSPMEKDMYIRDLAAKKFVGTLKDVVKTRKDFLNSFLLGSKAVGQDIMTAGYWAFSKIERLNRYNATVTALIKSSGFLSQQFYWEGGGSSSFREMPDDIQREVLREYALRARREDERVNFDYSQIMRPAYLRHAGGQLFFKFATFTQAAWIWRKRDYQAMKRDYRLLREGKIRSGGKTLTLGRELWNALGPRFFSPNKQNMVDQNVLLSQAYMQPGVWAATVETLVQKNPKISGMTEQEIQALRNETFKNIRKTLTKEGMPALQVGNFRVDEFNRGLRLSVTYFLETVASTAFHVNMGILREPLSEFTSAFIDLISFVTGNWWDDEDEVWTDSDGNQYDLSQDPRVQRAKRKMRDDLLRRLSFSSPVGGLYVSKVFQWFGDMVTDPLVAGERYYDDGARDNELWNVVSLRGIGPLAQMLRSILVPFASQIMEDDYSASDFGERDPSQQLLDALDLGEMNWSRAEYRRQLQKATSELKKGTYDYYEKVFEVTAKDYADRLNTDLSVARFFGLKNLSYAEKTNLQNDAVRVQKAIADVNGMEDFDNAYDRAVKYYEKKIREILTGAISRRQLSALEPVLGDKYNDLYNTYAGRTVDTLPEETEAQITEEAVQLINEKMRNWNEYVKNFVNQ